MSERDWSDVARPPLAEFGSARIVEIATARREPNSTEIALIDESPLRRTVTLNMLRAHIRKGGRSFGEAADLLKQVTGNCASPSCVIMCVGGRSLGEAPLLEQLRGLVRALASVPIVLMSDRDEREEAATAFHEGARGYITTSLQPNLVIKALKIVINGGLFVPADLLTRARSEAPPDRTTRPENTEQHWPARQLAVLELLVRGMANKEISNLLGMEESTVKAHVRVIMRKFGASNRTQVALRARQIHDFA